MPNDTEPLDGIEYQVIYLDESSELTQEKLEQRSRRRDTDEGVNREGYTHLRGTSGEEQTTS